jgi:hypothetical protein
MKKSNLIFFSIAIMLIISACGDKPSDPFGDFNPYDADLGRRIESYHDAKFPNLANSKTGNPAIYIDFSSGINNAFKEPVISKLMTDCFNTILAEKFDVFKLGEKKVTILQIANSTQLGEKISNPEEYKDIFAPIQEAVEKIVEGNNDALMITDFEEWQNNSEITSTAFLKIPFSKWLSKGNSIHFFIADYVEGKVSKHIYFTIFNCGNPNESSMISKLQAKLSSLKSYDLSNKKYKLTTNYTTAKSGGIFYGEPEKVGDNKKFLDLKESYVNGLNNGNAYEFYPLGVDWATIDELKKSYNEQHQFNDFFRKLFINLSDESAYKFGDFDVKVYDITDDFVGFVKCNEVKNHVPKLEKGTNGEDKFKDDENDPIALTCYDTKGKVKNEWIYKSETIKPTPLPEIFALNQELFKNNKSEHKNSVELGVSFDSKYSLKNIPNPAGLLRIDIVLISAAPNLDNPILENFKWINSKSSPNIALYESIKTTLQEVGIKPSNKVIYSYYIKTLQ